MVIVQLSGGLGNQMFEYALYLSLKAKGKVVKIDDITCYEGPGTRPKQLDVFGVSYERATKQELTEMTDSSLDPVSRIRRKLTGRKTKAYREKDINFDPQVMERDPALLEGCFQSERYFQDCREQVREAYRFRGIESGAYPLPEAFRRRLSGGKPRRALYGNLYRTVLSGGFCPAGKGSAGGKIFPVQQRSGLDEGTL